MDNSEKGNKEFLLHKKDFDAEYSKIPDQRAKGEYLLARINRANKSLEDIKENYPLSMQGETNFVYFIANVKFLEYLEQLKKTTISEEEEVKGKPTKDKLTHKQQILLLHSLGFFELDFFKNLNETQKGILIAHVVNRDEKNSEDNVRYVNGKRTNEDTQKIFTKTNIGAVNTVLQKIGLIGHKLN